MGPVGMTSSTPTASRQEIVARRRGETAGPPGSDAAGPDASGPPGPTAARPSWKLDVVGVLVVCALVIVAYFPVVFLGRTLSTAPLQPGTQGCGSRTGACVPYQDDDQRVDPLASAGRARAVGSRRPPRDSRARPPAVEPVPGHRGTARGEHAERAVRPGDARVPPAPHAARRGHHLHRRVAPDRDRRVRGRSASSACGGSPRPSPAGPTCSVGGSSSTATTSGSTRTCTCR